MQVATQTQPRARRARTVRTAINRRFRGYKPEKERAVRTPKVKEDTTLRTLKDAWRNFEWYKGTRYDTLYKFACDAIEGIGYSAKDVEKFSLALAEFQDETWFGTRAGMLLSALVNKGKGDGYTIHTNHLAVEIWWLGYENTRNITVEGRLGRFIGLSMDGGSITINGNVEAYIGISMKKGTMIVNGHAGNNIGYEMKGGEIHLNGTYQKLANNIRGGKVFHKGVQIYPEN